MINIITIEAFPSDFAHPTDLIEKIGGSEGSEGHVNRSSATSCVPTPKTASLCWVVRVSVIVRSLCRIVWISRRIVTTSHTSSHRQISPLNSARRRFSEIIPISWSSGQGFVISVKVTSLIT